MADLITYEMLNSRLGPNVEPDVQHAEALIADASALVRQIAEGELDAADHSTVAAAVVPVVVSAVRRALVNPDGFQSEMLDGYRFDGGATEGVFLTRREAAVVRREAGVLGSGSVSLESYMPTPKSESIPTEEVGWVDA